MKAKLLVSFLFIACATQAVAAEKSPPGWFPLSMLDDKPTWSEVREIKDRIHLHLPDQSKPVRGVFVCFVFHSGDPRELADLWNFALVTVPWPFEYDLGVNDKRNGRYKFGHEMQDMGLLLRYLDHAGEKLNRPELSQVPLVGWLGQNGSRMCADLYERAPERVLAWSDSFPNRLRQYPELTKKVPFPFAWEVSKADLRSGTRTYKKDPNPPTDLSCRATTYGHGHGIYSKFNFFMFYLDRCIRARMPETIPPPGQPVKLKPALRENGWVGVDEKGKESDVRPGAKLKVTAAELEFPSGKWNLAFQFQPPQHVTFEGTGMKFSVNSFTKDNWQVGFVRPDGFDAWRGKKKQTANSKP